MIIEWLVNVGCGFVSWLTTLLPTWDPPSWLTGAGDTFNSFFANFDGFGVWADWTLVGLVVAAVVAVWLIVAAVRLLMFIVNVLRGSGA